MKEEIVNEGVLSPTPLRWNVYVNLYSYRFEKYATLYGTEGVLIYASPF